jgi:UDP-N-acetylglucosamine diphosphorylase/glucosamine-1-phosphate N-acetyltransferase
VIEDAAPSELVFYDDLRARSFQPFALSRPFCEMRVGALLMRERWEHAFGLSTRGFVSAPQLADFTEVGAPRFTRDVIPAGSILVNSRAAVALTSARSSLLGLHAQSGTEPAGRMWTMAGRIAAIELTVDLPVSELNVDSAWPLYDALLERAQATNGFAEIDGVWIDEVWDVIRHLTPLLLADIPVIARARTFANVSSNTNGPIVTGRNPLYVEDGATIEPFTYFDTKAGPVLVRSGSVVQAFTRVVGPCYVGRDCIITADRIGGSAIGDSCRVHGELSASVFVGYSNKGHDGFVGHSIVGRWVNMGAGTITSNLKNTYGTVTLWTPDGVRDTGLQFIGTLFGDHVKTGIGLQLTTGCVLGTAANVFSTMPPKVVEPFAWGAGEPYATYDVNKFLETAARMMSRRDVELSETSRKYLLAVHAARWHAKSH